MGNIFKRYNSQEPLVLFDKLQTFKCFQLDFHFKSYLKLPVIDHIEGDKTASLLIQSMPTNYETVYIPTIKRNEVIGIIVASSIRKNDLGFWWKIGDDLHGAIRCICCFGSAHKLRNAKTEILCSPRSHPLRNALKCRSELLKGTRYGFPLSLCPSKRYRYGIYERSLKAVVKR